MNFVIQWIDVIWLPIAWFVVHKHQRSWTMGLIVSCMVMMRLQIELMVSIGYENGLVGFFDAHVSHRALTVYSLFYMLFIGLAAYSPNTRQVIVMGAAISVFFAAFFISTLIMVL